MPTFDVFADLGDRIDDWVEGKYREALFRDSDEPLLENVEWLEESALDVMEIATEPPPLYDHLLEVAQLTAYPLELDAFADNVEMALHSAPGIENAEAKSSSANILDIAQCAGQAIFDLYWAVGYVAMGVIGTLLGLFTLPVIGLLPGRKKLMRRICDNEPAIANHLQIARLPTNDRYVVFSDHHIFERNKRLDAFGKARNDELYREVLQQYARDGFFLIENGDVEDLWERNPTIGNLVFGYASIIPSAFYVGPFLDDPYQALVEKFLLRRIIDGYREMYDDIATLFYEQGRYIRLQGNHDLNLRKESVRKELDDVYSGIVIHDAVVLVPMDTQGFEVGDPAVLIMHGHQLDAWNNPVMGNAAGAPITAFFSNVLPDQAAAKLLKKAEWEKDMFDKGFENRLKFYLLPHTPEKKIRRILNKTFDTYPPPHLILGHTHVAEWNARIKKCGSDVFENYTNGSTAGRHEQLIWCVEIVDGQVSLHTWFRENGELINHLMVLNEDGDLIPD